jgi:hypothetical protein
MLFSKNHKFLVADGQAEWLNQSGRYDRTFEEISSSPANETSR